MNPLFNQFSANNNFMQIMSRFNEFKNNFKGDPKDEVMKLLQSGRMSNQQFNQLQSMANQFQSMMGKMK